MKIRQKEELLRKFNLTPDDFISRGAFGEAYAYKDKILKISFQHFENENQINNFKSRFAKDMNYLMDNKQDFICDMYDFDFISSDDHYVYFYYICERLNKLSGDEMKAMRYLVSHEDFNIEKKFDIKKSNKYFDEIGGFLDINELKVKEFIMRLDANNKSKIRFIHRDMHERNIMKDHYNTFKLIDMDSIFIDKSNA